VVGKDHGLRGTAAGRFGGSLISTFRPPLATDRGGASDDADYAVEDLRVAGREADHDTGEAGSEIGELISPPCWRCMGTLTPWVRKLCC
jgi:hypothetical protein